MYARQEGRPYPQKLPREKSIREYIYTHDGNPVVKVVRRDYEDGKVFSQHYWNGYRWEKGCPKEVRGWIHLYGLGAEQPHDTEPLFLVEGEEVCKWMSERGLKATTAIGGAGKWKQYGYENYRKDLEPWRTIVLCPDLDIKGVKHMEEVEADLLAWGHEVRWLYAFPESKQWRNVPSKCGVDLKDWGASRQEMLDAIGEKAHSMPTEDGTGTGDGTRGERKRKWDLPSLVEKAAEALDERLQWNTLRLSLTLDGQEVTHGRVRRELAAMGVHIPVQEAKDVALAVGERNPVNPVEEYLRKCPQGRDEYLYVASTYLGGGEVEDRWMATFLRASVLRSIGNKPVSFPYVLVLVGESGCGKTRTLTTLFQWVYRMESIRDPRAKEETARTQLVLWDEMSVLPADGTIATMDLVNAYITDEWDTYSVMYEAKGLRVPRRAVIAGTTTRQEYLTDGYSQRRWLTIPIPRGHRVDVDRLKRDAARIWGSAYASVLDAPTLHLPQSFQEEVVRRNREYSSAHPWEPEVLEIAAAAGETFTTEDVMRVLFPAAGSRPRDAISSIAAILTANGYVLERCKKRGAYRDKKVWYRPSPA